MISSDDFQCNQSHVLKLIFFSETERVIQKQPSQLWSSQLWYRNCIVLFNDTTSGFHLERTLQAHNLFVHLNNAFSLQSDLF